MVDCLAYGTVSESSKPQGTSTSEIGTGIYEANYSLFSFVFLILRIILDLLLKVKLVL